MSDYNFVDGFTELLFTAGDTGNKLWVNATGWNFEGRDKKNVILESYNEILDESKKTNGKWILLDYDMSIYHQNGIGSEELKFVCIDGREAVFTKDFSKDGSYELVTDSKYKGTYNYCPPAPKPKNITDVKGISNFVLKATGHFFADVLPYYLAGKNNDRI